MVNQLKLTNLFEFVRVQFWEDKGTGECWIDFFVVREVKMWAVDKVGPQRTYAGLGANRWVCPKEGSHWSQPNGLNPIQRGPYIVKVPGEDPNMPPHLPSIPTNVVWQDVDGVDRIYRIRASRSILRDDDELAREFGSARF